MPILNNLRLRCGVYALQINEFFCEHFLNKWEPSKDSIYEVNIIVNIFFKIPVTRVLIPRIKM